MIHGKRGTGGYVWIIIYSSRPKKKIRSLLEFFMMSSGCDQLGRCLIKFYSTSVRRCCIVCSTECDSKDFCDTRLLDENIHIDKALAAWNPKHDH